MDFYSNDKNSPNDIVVGYYGYIRWCTALSSSENYDWNHCLFKYTLSRWLLWFFIFFLSGCSNDHDLKSLCFSVTKYSSWQY